MIATSLRILHALAHIEYDSNPKFMGRFISPVAVGASISDWLKTMHELQDDGYIDGVTFINNVYGVSVDIFDVHITPKGTAYLDENLDFLRFCQMQDLDTNVIRLGHIYPTEKRGSICR